MPARLTVRGSAGGTPSPLAARLTVRGSVGAGTPPASLNAKLTIRGSLGRGDVPVGMVASGPTDVMAGGQTVTLSIAGTDGAAMDTVAIAQRNGNQVVMFGTGRTRTFTAPYDPRGITLTFDVTGTRAGSSSTATVTVQVAPHAWWGCYGNPIAWRPLQPFVSDGTQWSLATARQ